VLAWFENREKELANRPLTREQAFAEALDADKLERLGRYEVHLNRKLERMPALLLRLKDPWQGPPGADSVWQNDRERSWQHDGRPISNLPSKLNRAGTAGPSGCRSSRRCHAILQIGFAASRQLVRRLRVSHSKQVDLD
jgi:hypothetical protein